MTIREQILDAFSSKVSADRSLRIDGDSDLPARSIWDNEEEAEKTKYGKMRCSFDVPVEYMAKVDLSTFSSLSAQANSMLGEIISEATSGDNSLGGLCRSIDYSGAEFIFPQDGEQEIEVFVVFNIIYEFVIGDPSSA